MPKKTNTALFSHRSSIFRIPNKKGHIPKNDVFIGGLMNKGVKAIKKRRGGITRNIKLSTTYSK